MMRDSQLFIMDQWFEANPDFVDAYLEHQYCNTILCWYEHDVDCFASWLAL